MSAVFATLSTLLSNFKECFKKIYFICKNNRSAFMLECSNIFCCIQAQTPTAK